MAKDVASKIILAGDIGGTKARLGIFDVTRGRLSLIFENTFINRNYKGLEDVLQEFLSGRKDISAACIGVAGPVIDGMVKATNIPWRVDIKKLKGYLSIRKAEIINDLVANAYGISLLKKDDFETLNQGRVKKGNAVLISAGTGLGEAILFWDGKRHVPFPSEGGHAEFGPRNRLEIELLRYLLERYGHVSYERLLSGAGLFNIYQFLRHSKRFGREPKWLSRMMGRGEPASIISEIAHLKRNRLCVMALNLFTSIYGAAAGNLSLKAMAVGGVYIGGGIAPKIVWELKDRPFMDAFKDKGRLSEILAQIPVKVIMNEKAALYGAALHAIDLLVDDKDGNPLFRGDTDKGAARVILPRW